MATTYTTNKQYDKPAVGDTGWGPLLTTNFDTIDSNLAGTFTQALASTATVNISQADSENLRIKLTGTLTLNVTVRLPSGYAGFWIIDNQTTGNFSVTIKTTAGGSAGITVTQGSTVLVFCDGTDVVRADSEPPSSVAGSNVTFSATTEVPGVSNVQSAIDYLGQRKMMPGTIFAYAGPTAPGRSLICDGSNVSRTTYADLYAALVTDAGFAYTTFTCTTANPAVFTKGSHGFVGGERLRLKSTSALPNGLSNSTDYYVEVLNPNTFYLKTNPLAGSANRVATTSAGAGTFSYKQSYWGLGNENNGDTNFTLPDLRGMFLRMTDRSRGIDADRPLGTLQDDQNAEHTHTATTNTTVTINSGGAHTHQIRWTESQATGDGSGRVDDIGSGANTGNTQSDGAHTHTNTATSTTTIADSGGAEARPINVAVIYCIAY